tara:strand:- start:4317 stop:5720 length:1404 start_codon:yes stop_codon:yes gene_type:complete
MASPLKVYNSGSAIQVMTDAEIDSMIVPLVLQEFASNQVYSVRGNCTAYANNDGNIGSFDNRYRGDDVGDHPISAGNFTTTTWSLYQEQSNAVSTANVIYPTKFISSGNKLQQMSFADLTATILARVSNNWRTNLYPVGGYYFGTAAPDADTWIYAGDALTETFRQAGADSAVVYRLWRKTAPNTSSGDRPVYNRTGSDGVQEMTDDDIKSLAAEWRNYLMNSSVGEDIGYYKLVVGTSTPTPGTWVQTGAYTDYLTDTGDVIYSQGYEGIYSQMYEGIYSGQYLGLYSGQFTGIYSGQFTGIYSGQFTGLYSRGYEGFYSQGYSGGYAGGYQGPYQGGYTIGYTVTYGSGSEAPNPRASSEGGSFSHTYSGVYSGVYSATFSGQYSNQFAGFYSNQYEGVYSQGFQGIYSQGFEGIYSSGFEGYYSQMYVGMYSGQYSGFYSNQYTGRTVLASLDSQPYTFWKRIN